MSSAAADFERFMNGRKFKTILADPPWQFQNRTGKVAPEHKRLSRYGTMTLSEIKALPVRTAAADTAHLYLWVPNALLPEGLAVMQAWGFKYKSNIVWHKIRKDGGPDGRGVGFYFRQCDRNHPVRRAWEERANPSPRTQPGQYHLDAQARALAQTRRTVSDHYVVQRGSIPRAVCARRTRRMGGLG